MKFIHISDTHGLHRGLKIPPGDCLIISGDFTNIGTIAQVAAFNAWLGTLPHKHKILVAGNHDRLFETDPSLARSLITNAIYLQDEEVTIEGIRIYGSPHQIEFCNWAFNLPTGDPLKAKWDLIPVGVDILVTHSPPYGVKDYVLGSRALRHLGCPELLEAVMRVRPAFHLFGHIHYAYGKESFMGVTFINSAICTEAYIPTNDPHVFEFTKDLTTAK